MKQPLGFILKQIHDKFQKDLNLLNKKEDITASQSVVLWNLYRHSDKITTQKQLQEHLQLAHPTVIGLLKRLEEKGLVEISTNQDDKRCRNISLTQTALAKQEEIRKRRETCEKIICKGMSEEEVETLRRLLGIVLNNLDELPKIKQEESKEEQKNEQRFI